MLLGVMATHDYAIQDILGDMLVRVIKLPQVVKKKACVEVK